MDILQESAPKSEQHPQDSKFVGELSRDLRSPLNAMIGFASLMKDPSLSEPDRQQFIDRILSNGDQLLQLLEDALNFSKLASGEAKIEKTVFNISEMVYDVINTLKSAAEKKELDIHIVFKTPIPQTIQSDPLKLKQILSNVLGNCIRYGGENGFVLVSISCEEKSAKDTASRLLSIEIDDSASGIQDFHNTRPGFLLSQQFAESLSGHLEVRPSPLGKGSCFILQLPTGDLSGVPFLNKKKSQSFLEKISNSLPKANRLQGVRILLAEDSADNEIVIKFYLSKEGASLTYVQNGLEAVDAVKHGHFDIILMDIEMPLLDGLEATRQIRQLGFQKTIIALTGNALRDDAVKSLKAGCDTHLTKPISKEPLVAEILKRL